MGKKSRSKRKATPGKSLEGPTASAGSLVAADSAPSLVASSAGFQPKGRTGEDLLQVRRGDIRRIGWLLLLMAVLFVGLGLASRHTGSFASAGSRISRTLGF